MSRSFIHHQLDAYRVALDLAVAGAGIADRVPRGYRGLADQLKRSAPAVALLIAEGANRFSSPQKRQRYVEARGECGEAAATVEVLAALGVLSNEEAEPFYEIAGRVGAMLTGLIGRHS